MNMEVFGTTRYLGKGLYDPRAFERSGASDVPDDSLLSHDLVEGAHAGVIAASDVTLREDVPGTLVSYLTRLHRWTRGDLQALPWCLPWVRRSGGRLPRNPLSLVNRYWIGWLALDALFIPACTVTVVSAWFVGSVQARAAYAAVVAVLLWPAVFRVIVRCVQAALGRIPLRGLAPLLRAQSQLPLTSALLILALMPVVAVVLLDAMVRTGVRMLITRRRLLEWRTAAQGERQSQKGGTWFTGALTGGVGVALGGAGLALVYTGPRADIMAVAALWAVAPATAYVLQRVQMGNRSLASSAIPSKQPLPSAPVACDIAPDDAKAMLPTNKPQPELALPTARQFQDATPDDVLMQMCAAYGIQMTGDKEEMRQRLRAAMMPDDLQSSGSSERSTKS
jgi:cyclic beta-1,2-glucan synthetase